jgi:hypothetical protein
VAEQFDGWFLVVEKEKCDAQFLFSLKFGYLLKSLVFKSLTILQWLWKYSKMVEKTLKNCGDSFWWQVCVCSFKTMKVKFQKVLAIFELKLKSIDN